MQSESQFVERGIQYINAARDKKEALTALVQAAGEAAGSTSATLYLKNARLGVLEPFILVNVPEEYLEGCSVVPLGTQCCGRAALHKMPWAVDDMWNDPLFLDCRDAAMKSGMRSGMSVPILTPEGECIGTLGCQFNQPNQTTSFGMKRMQLFAELIAAAAIKAGALEPASTQTGGDRATSRR